MYIGRSVNAPFRLPEDDPVIQDLLGGWAFKSAQDGNLPLAAKCWTAAAKPNKAADILAKIGTKSSLQECINILDRIVTIPPKTLPSPQPPRVFVLSKY